MVCGGHRYCNFTGRRSVGLASCGRVGVVRRRILRLEGLWRRQLDGCGAEQRGDGERLSVDAPVQGVQRAT